MAVGDLVSPVEGIAVTAAVANPDRVTVSLKATSRDSTCPACGRKSRSIHSHYQRTVAELPWQGRPVRLLITVRRFRCRNADCSRKVFCERLPQFLAAKARTTVRLAEAHTVIGFALGGEAGSRLAGRLAVLTSPDTLLRRVRAAPRSSHPTPRVLGVDDFAFRKGAQYGTILMDLERRMVVDLLPDRRPETLIEWLNKRPGVEIVSRDRATNYASAVTTGAPSATQVADRFHLLVNLREAAERILQTKTGALRAALSTAIPVHQPERDENPQPWQKRQPERQAKFDEVRTLHQEGRSLRGIAKDLRLHYRTVEKYVRSDALSHWGAGERRASKLDPHADFLRERLRDGRTNVTSLHKELQARGCPLGASVVREYVRRLRGENGMTPVRPSRPLSQAAIPPPSTRSISMTIVRPPSQRTEKEKELLNRLNEKLPELTEPIALVEAFAAMIRERRSCELESWMEKAKGHPILATFAAGVQRDLAAVKTGMSLPWSNGPVEGSVNRLKYIKRSGYGRMNLDLLTARVLNAK